MIETQIIKENKKPVAIILDYNEFLKMKEALENVEDYENAVRIKNTNQKWTTHNDLKKEFGF